MDNMVNKSPSRVVRWAFILGIIIVLNLLFGVGVSMFYESPDFGDFCGSKEPVVEAIENQNACTESGGQWIEHGATSFDGRPVPIKIDDTQGGYCDTTFTCRQDYDDARDSYNKTRFIALIILGLISIVAGISLKKHDVISSALSLGGVLSLIIASISYWSSAPDFLKFILLVVALAVLIWFGIKKFKE